MEEVKLQTSKYIVTLILKMYVTETVKIRDFILVFE